MKINGKFFIYSRREDGAIITNIMNEDNRTECFLKQDMQHAMLNRIMSVCRTRKNDDETKNRGLVRVYRMLGFNDDQIADRLYITGDAADAAATVAAATDSSVPVIDKAKFRITCERLIQFFSEFNYSPSHRFLNSLIQSKNKTAYVCNYFRIQDHNYATEISEKVKSAEFKAICDELKGIKIKPINTRLEVYFGEPGSGKTTKAMTLADKCMVCSSDMLPADLMQNFCFKDGKADFDPSDLWKAMENGETIVLDEINMLPFESLRFLQGITDGKTSFDYKGHTINIKPGFKIYATMNLNVNGQTIPLPEPLVDRSYEIVEFKLSADDLVNAALSMI